MQRSRFSINYNQIYEEAEAAGLVEQMEDELTSFGQVLNDNYEFKLFFEDPRISADYKKKVFKKICPDKISRQFVAVVHMLIDLGREELVPDLAREFTVRLYKDLGILFGVVRSPLPITDNFKKPLLEAMTKLKKTQVRLRYFVDPSLLGGLSIRLVTGEVWDLSLKHKLEDIKAAILN